MKPAHSTSSPVSKTTWIALCSSAARNETEYDGGGAVWVRGGRFKIINCRFFNNVCADLGPDVGGAAVRVFSQYDGLPVYVVNSTFGGAEGFGNTCSNGGGISSIGVSWTIINSLFTHNEAIGNGGAGSQAKDDGTGNVWDNGYPSGGNYWSDYSGLDVMGGENQDIHLHILEKSLL